MKSFLLGGLKHMFYGNAIFKQQNNIIENSTVDSVIYNEYLNRCNLLEACTDEYDSVILEAQAEVLYELSIKEVWKNIKEWIRKRLLAIVKGLEKLFSKGKKTKFKDWILRLINRGKKLLGDVEKAENEEEIENCKKEVESFSDEYKDAVNNISNDLNKAIDQLEANDADKELTQIYRQFRTDVLDIAKRATETKNEDEIDKLKQELNDRYKQHEENINNYKAQKLVSIFKDKIKGFSSRSKNNK